MKLGRIIRRAALYALAVSAIPYCFKWDKDNGSWEVRSLLWGVRKTPGEGKDHFSVAIPACELDSDKAKQAVEAACAADPAAPAEA